MADCHYLAELILKGENNTCILYAHFSDEKVIKRWGNFFGIQHFSTDGANSTLSKRKKSNYDAALF